MLKLEYLSVGYLAFNEVGLSFAPWLLFIVSLTLENI